MPRGIPNKTKGKRATRKAATTRASTKKATKRTMTPKGRRAARGR